MGIAQEVTPFGIRVCNLITGQYQTGVYEATSHDRVRSIEEYDPVRNYLLEYIRTHHLSERGDPRKAAAVVVDAVHGDGDAQGKTLPLRLPLGPDAVDAVKNTCALNMTACEEWETVVSKTDFDGYKGT